MIAAGFITKKEVAVRVSGSRMRKHNLVTPFFHNTGWTANGVTIARIPIALVGVVLLMIPNPLVWVLSAAMYYICYILDCVDGNLARIQNDASYFGKFLDGVSDAVYEFFAAFCLGIGLWLQQGESVFLIVGAISTIVSLLNHYLRSRLSFFREWMISLTGPLTEAEVDAASKPRALQEKCMSCVINSFPLVLPTLFIADWGAMILMVLLVVTRVVPEVVWICTTFAESNALLRRSRVSRSARVKALSDDPETVKNVDN